MSFDQTLDGYIQRMMPTYTKQLMELVGIPSISAGTYPIPSSGTELQTCLERRDVLLHMVEAIGDILESYKFEHHIVAGQDHNPLLVASLCRDPRMPWVTIYNHMDVQPAAEPEWETDPFKPQLIDGKIIGRGATDDKGPALAVIHAVNFLDTHSYALPNVQVVYETEEEIGSPNFGRVLKQIIGSGMMRHPDSILISDTTFHGDHPTLTYKMRGMLRMYLALQTASKDAHSGTTGSVAVNAYELLTRAILSCKAEDGTILVPGFYEGIQSLTEKEEEELGKATPQFDLTRFKQDTGLGETTTNDPYTALQRIWHEPTFEMHGAEGIQYRPREIKSVVPGNVVGKVSVRLVPGQDPDDIIKKVQAHVVKTHPGIKVTGNGQPGCIIDTENDFSRMAEQACLYGFGRLPIYVGGGATIGSVPQFQSIYPGVPIVLLAQSLLSDGYHAPNEHFRLDQAEKGIRVMAKYLNSIASMTDVPH